jgi:cytochrome c-type biogenesis protein CcmE
MNRKKYFFGFAMIITALLLLIVVNFKQSMQYYMTVDEMYGSLPLLQNREFRLSGTVVKGSLRQTTDDGSPVYDFIIANGPKTVQVIYRGLAPDTFKDTSDVVVRGKLDQKKMVFYADHLLAKCASKYEAKLNHQSVKL